MFLKIAEQKNQYPKNPCWNSTYASNHRLECNFNKKDFTVEVILRIAITSWLRVSRKAIFHEHLQTATYKTQTQPLSLQLATLQKLKSFMDIFEGFCLLSRNIYLKECFLLTLSNHFWVKIMVFPLKIRLSQIVNKISKPRKSLIWGHMFILNKQTTSQLCRNYILVCNVDLSDIFSRYYT